MQRVRTLDRRTLLAALATPLVAAWLSSRRPTAAARPDATPGLAATPVSTPDRAGVHGALDVVRDQRPTYAGPSVRGGVLRLARPKPATFDFNPLAMRPDPQFVYSIFEPLLRPDPVTMEPTPWLATDWTTSDDGLTIAVPLRRDVRWHDGAPFIAADAATTLLAYRDDSASVVSNLFTALADAKAIDDGRLEVRLTEPDGNFPLNALTQPIVQRAQYEAAKAALAAAPATPAAGGWATMPPIGTGPWKVAELGREAVRLERNADYWGDAAEFDRCEIAWVDGEANRVATWRNRTTDLLWPVPAADLASLGQRPGRLYAADAASVMFAAFNFVQPDSLIPDLFTPVDLRRALSIAIDRDRYAREVFGGFIQQHAAGTVAQPWAHDDSITAPRHDPERAAGLLRSLGWADINGDGVLESPAGVPFIVKVVLAADARPELARLLARVKEDLLQIGVVLNIDPLNAADLAQALTATRDFDLVAYAYDLYPGFTDWDLYGSAWDIRTNPLGWNPGGYANADADAAIADFLKSRSLAAQRAALMRLQQAADRDLFGLW
ncbi:MAG TPA: ABC transporter substrate-binding protein, partial [Thermomicrobiales bacterium]|nr:ABC transporter substrate-binding protein [Thermomicrobiales bacterium]